MLRSKKDEDQRFINMYRKRKVHQKDLRFDYQRSQPFDLELKSTALISEKYTSGKHLIESERLKKDQYAAEASKYTKQDVV